MPVPADARVETLTLDGRRAFGVAVAFNWSNARQTDVVAYWRFYMPDWEKERRGILQPRPPVLPWL